MGSISIPEVDVLLVGAGFGAFTMFNKLRAQGLKCKIYEKGSSSGGVWYWNCYPGARVDTDTPVYQLFDKELWSTFTFKERYAGQLELKRYFEHVEKTWDIKKDIIYNKFVEGATFDEERRQWLVECSDGSKIYCRWFIPGQPPRYEGSPVSNTLLVYNYEMSRLKEDKGGTFWRHLGVHTLTGCNLAIGFASRRYIPPVKGLSDFKGDIYHTAVWPQHGVNLNNKRVAIIGTGASGIQCIQEIGSETAHLTIYQRTPNYCLPMNQRLLDEKEEEKSKADGKYEEAFAQTYKTFLGFTYDFSEKNTFDDSPEERERFFHHLMIENGGFHFWLATYKDMLFDQKANDEAYKFWRKSVLKRITDEKKAALLAPEKPPHPWGTKRPSLEQNFYEVVSMPHIDIIDINVNPIEEITTNGISTKLGHVEVDIIILATGFDSVSGPFTHLNIRGTKGGTIADHWKDGIRTSMGIAMPDFPNMFFMYGPQAPTAFSNGPSCNQVQAEWIDRVIKTLAKNGITRIEAKREAEEDWCKRVKETWDAGLFSLAKSWYQGSNIPGKRVEPLNWAGGLNVYREALDKSIENDYQDWIVG